MNRYHGIVLGLLIAASGCTTTPKGGGTVAAPAEDRPYPFTYCIVSGEEFSPYKEPYIVRHEGQIYKLCCKDCFADFKEDPAPHVEKFNALVQRLAANP
jgi:hypothetical protein